MAQRKPAPPAPWWISLPGLLLQSVGLFVLPFVVGLVASMLFEVSEVAETLPWLLGFTTIVLVPISLAQVLGLVLKSRKEIRWWRQRGELSLSRLLHVLHSHLRVVTLRGWIFLLLGLGFVVLALAARWASFGVMAAVGLFLFYAVTGWTVFASTFLVRTFEIGMGRSRSGIQRQMVPAVVLQGEPVEEVLTYRRVPIPWGYLLVVEDPLPARLRTESRYVLGASAKRREVETRGLLRATPRGHFHLGPARLWYQDTLGITRVSVASVATADLKVLPRFRPVEVIDPPRTPQQAPDVITRHARFATEDHFRFREYAAGDDTRRIHWRLSLRSGHLQVRLPEAREISTQDVVLLLDCYLPKGKALDAAHGADDILDALVEAWLGVARSLLDKGDRVTLLAAVPSHDGSEVRIEKLDALPSESPRWQDMGARARWQGDYDLPEILSQVGETAHGVVVTARFTAPPPGLEAGQTLTWLFMDPADALGPPDRHWLLESVAPQGSVLKGLLWAFRLPHAAGSEENSLPRRWRATWRRSRLYRARKALRSLARRRAGHTLSSLHQRGDAVYRLEKLPGRIRLVGLQGQVRGGHR